MTSQPTLLLTAFPLPQKGQDTGSAQPVGPGPGPQAPPGTAPGTTTTEQPSGPPPSMWDACGDQLPFILLLFGVFYFLLIRPQQKQEKKRREMVAALRKGDRVVMNSGLHGTIDQVGESTVTLRAGGDVRLTFDRTAIARVESGGEDAAPPAKTD